MLRKLKLKECILLMGDKLSVITGATGHVGYALVKELEARGENFRILIRKDSKIFDGINCERVFGDVTDPASLEKAFDGADVVYHLAGVIEINKGNEDMTWKVNVDGTKNVVEACKKCGVKRLVYASSVDAYPPLPDNQARSLTSIPRVLTEHMQRPRLLPQTMSLRTTMTSSRLSLSIPALAAVPMTSRSLPSARWSECSSRASSPYRSPSAHITSLTCAMLQRA